MRIGKLKDGSVKITKEKLDTPPFMAFGYETKLECTFKRMN